MEFAIYLLLFQLMEIGNSFTPATKRNFWQMAQADFQNNWQFLDLKPQNCIQNYENNCILNPRHTLMKFV